MPTQGAKCLIDLTLWKHLAGSHEEIVTLKYFLMSYNKKNILQIRRDKHKGEGWV